jgi:hypothetical protein
MSLHTELPIYKDAYALLDLIVEITKHIPRDFKRLIGEKMREECLEITILIFRANIHRDKGPHLTDLLERQQVLELILRLARAARTKPPRGRWRYGRPFRRPERSTAT